MTARRALLVASASYADPRLTTLRTPSHDVDGLAQVLTDPAIGAFTVRKVVNQTDATVRREVGRFLRQADRRDTLLLFFGCHGVTDLDGQLHLTAHDTVVSDLEVTALPAELLSRLIDRSPSRRVILILDCCYSGAISRSMARRGGDLDLGAVFAGQGEGRAVLTASRAEEYAWEPAGGAVRLVDNPLHSVFAEALVEGLRTGEADVDQDGEVSVEDLYQYTYGRVRAKGSHQTPSRWTFSHGTLFVAHRAPATRPTGLTTKSAAKPAGARSPWDATLLHWAFPVTAQVGQHLRARARTGAEAQAWGALANGQVGAGAAAFQAALDADRSSGTAWWGRAVCHAAQANWPAAAACFEQAGDTLGADPDDPAGLPLYCGAMLLGATTSLEAHPARARDLVDAALERAPYCPELLAYRGILLDRQADLADAFRLSPDLVADFTAVGVEVGAAATEAVASAERDLAALIRVLAGIDVARGDGPRPPPVRPSHLASAADRLGEYRNLVRQQRFMIANEISKLQILTDELLAKAVDFRTMTLVRVIREWISDGSTVLAQTDRPVSVHVIGVPSRTERLR
ncbi:caspase family protein [Dactylosporangium matsuzakiense]|uniref:Peptidase C14 caspase domain-containing protein n=1 Tax=Dactylosporangium matsuzakiense TaxID=53360 RepID=A0A9W6KPH4_9ACTN|nr:caspase family protein [Dactylosporangium matsuzakiense]UWZ44642.1 caspase family protein [Dactylosporangium matsuzakiense]GLL04650.1 hypothetical protein GCM10017581_063970 [Dactylosporangium matsuzakiense]